MIQTSKLDQPKCKLQESKMAGKLQLLAIIFAISMSVGYAKGPNKIINGQFASIGEFPHQVSLQLESGWHFCGGAIISDTLILTAAHCIIGDDGTPTKNAIYVVTGTNDKQQYDPNNIYKVIRRIYHNYQPIGTVNDIAILQVNRQIVFNNVVKPAKLPSQGTPAGSHVMSSGWGATVYDNGAHKALSSPRYLQKLDRIVVGQGECQEHMPSNIVVRPGNICVWSPNNAATCVGDSGGPLTYNGVVLGVTSYGIGGCALNYPDVYTSAWYYLPWIQQAKWYLDNHFALPKNSQNMFEAYV